MYKSRLFGAAFSVILSLNTFSSHAAYFTGMGGLPAGTFFESKALGISGDGLVVVGSSDYIPPSTSSPVREAFSWTLSGGFVGLNDLPGGEFLSAAHAASYDGSVLVGRARSTSDEEAFRWTESTGMVGFGERSIANDVSADGSVVVGRKAGLINFEAFRWTEATGMVGLGTVDGAVQSFAEAVSANGEIVVGRTNTEGFRWTESGGIEGLGDLRVSPPYPISEAYGISADGSITVGGARNSAGQDEAFRWSETTGIDGLGILQGQDINPAADVSADGSIIVGLAGNFIAGEAFIWDESDGLRSLKSVLENDFGLDLTGWDLIAASGISDDGSTIVGFGTNPDGMTEAWIANTAVIPIPPAIWLFGSGLLGMIGIARRKKAA